MLMKSLKRKRYEKLLEPMQAELVAMARWVAATGQRVCILFEGRDTAGKGGAIKAIADKLNPRQCRVVALGKPSEGEKGQWYFQRYVPHLPGKGEIVLFDRSWYNRAGVEKVMGFATDEQVEAFLKAVAGVREAAGRRRHPAVQVLADLRPGEAGRALRRAARRSAEALEAVADRPGGADEIRRLHRGPRGDAEGDAHASTRRGRWSISTTRSAAG